MNKFLSFVKSKSKIFACSMSALLLGMASTFVVGAEPTTLDTFIASIKTALADFTPTTLGTVLVAALGITVALVLAWFAYRWVVRKVSGALKKGRL